MGWNFEKCDFLIICEEVSGEVWLLRNDYFLIFFLVFRDLVFVGILFVNFCSVYFFGLRDFWGVGVMGEVGLELIDVISWNKMLFRVS